MAQKSSWNMYYNCMQESELSEVTLTHHQVRDTIPTSLPSRNSILYLMMGKGHFTKFTLLHAVIIHIPARFLGHTASMLQYLLFIMKLQL